MDELDVWAAFWADAGTHGCTDGFPPVVQGKLATDWAAIFASATGKVLDVGCGRGALYFHARKAGVAADDWLGVDLASIAAADFPFRGRIDAAALPFEDGSFAMVVSQYGLEYAGLLLASVEAARVCSGEIVALVHARDGAPCMQAREQVNQIDWLLNEMRMADRLRIHFASPTVPTAASVNELLKAIIGRMNIDTNVSLLQAIWHSVMATQEANGEPMRAVRALEVGLMSFHARLTAMLEAAPDTATLAITAEALRARGFALQVEDAVVTTRNGGPMLVGRWFRANRLL